MSAVSGPTQIKCTYLNKQGLEFFHCQLNDDHTLGEDVPCNGELEETDIFLTFQGRKPFLLLTYQVLFSNFHIKLLDCICIMILYISLVRC